MTFSHVTFEGAEELKGVLRTMTDEARGDLVRDVAMAGAAEVLPDVIARAPVLKESDPRRVVGNLKSKIHAFMIKQKPNQATFGVGLSSADMHRGALAVFYASWVEYGTRFMAAIPFLRPAFDARKAAAEAAMTAKVRAWLDRFTR